MMKDQKKRVLRAYSQLPIELLTNEYNLYAMMLVKGENEQVTLKKLQDYIKQFQINIEV